MVEFKSTILQSWIPVSSVGVHATMNRAKLASRALNGTFKRVRVRCLDSGSVAHIREADSGRYCGSLLLSLIIFLLMVGI